MGDLVSLAKYLPARTDGARADKAPVVFDRRELELILRVYGRKVVAGEWRDYSLLFDSNCATFAVGRSAFEVPEFRIVKSRSGTPRFAVIARGGRIVRRGDVLADVLRQFDGKRRPTLLTG